MNKAEVMEKIEQSGIIPVAVVDKAEKAIPLANAMLAGGVDVVEVTFRTEAAPDVIKQMSTSCKKMLVGAGTVISLEQCKKAVECGAQFIVSPGFNKEVVKWCVDNEVPIVPGCVTPTEITEAMEMGLKVVKFFPCNLYGGVTAMKALSGPFPCVRFIPTSGINADTIADFIKSPYVFAAGGSWVCSKNDIANENYEKITALCADAKKRILGFEIGHIGINSTGADDAKNICMDFNKAFDFEYMPGTGSSDFASKGIEVKKRSGRGEHGHIAVTTNSLVVAMAELKKRGVELDESSKVIKNGKLIAVFLKNQIGGFAVHLMAK